jgi:hypothetical protein
LRLDETEAASLLGRIQAGPGEVRAIRFPERFRWGRVSVDSVRFEGVHFNASFIAGHVLRRALLSRCTFNDCDFGGVYLDRAKLVDCAFTACRFLDRTLTVVDRCLFETCTFDGCSMGDFNCARTTLKSCSFERLDGRKLRLEGCRMEGVRMEGRLESTTFLKTTWSASDLSRSMLLDSTFVPFPAGGLRLPDRPENFVIHPRALRNAAGELKSKISSEDLEHYRRAIEFLKDTDPPEVLSEAFFPGMSAEGRRKVIETMYGSRENSSGPKPDDTT